ncbi:MAG: hypothetical protein IOD12_10915 [Silvanigrellales bacterium]|nr:hypothetical protein [Silvanigrellales bacterium]
MPSHKILPTAFAAMMAAFFSTLSISCSHVSEESTSSTQMQVITADCVKARSSLAFALNVEIARGLTRSALLGLVEDHSDAVACAQVENESVPPREGWRLWKNIWNDNPDVASNLLLKFIKEKYYVANHLDSGIGIGINGTETPLIGERASLIRSHVISGSARQTSVVAYDWLASEAKIEAGSDLLGRVLDIEKGTTKARKIPSFVPGVKDLLRRQDPCETLYNDGALWLSHCKLGTSGKDTYEVFERVTLAK